MPEIIMHNHFARVVYSSLDGNIQKAIDNVNLYEYASIMYDSFGFYKFWSKDKRKQANDLYRRMHSRNVKSLFEDLIKQAKINHFLFPVIAGNMCHYYLDAYTHPYIYYRTGDYNPNINNTIKYRGLHMKMEKAMDAYIIESYYSGNAKNFKIASKIMNLDKLPFAIKDDINYAYNKNYHFSNGYDFINKCIKHEKLFYLITYSPFGIKTKFLSKIDNGKSLIDYNYLTYYNSIINTRKYDIFNFKHERWFNPADDRLTSIDSFFDLFDKAKEDCKAAIEALYKYIYSDDVDNNFDIDKYIKDINLFTGLNANGKNEIQYYDNIFE